MGLVSQSVKNIFGGVSQLPSEQRDGSTWSALINWLPFFRRKLTRRPPTLYVAKLSGSVLANACVQRLDAFNVVVGGGAIAVYDAITGAAQTVYVRSGLSYLTSVALRSLAVGDTAYFLNPSATVAKITTRTAHASPIEAFLYFRQGDYGTTYTVLLNSLRVSYTTPNNTGPTDKVHIATDYIAGQVANAIQTNAVLAGVFTVENLGSTLHITTQLGKDFTISGTDGLGGLGMAVIKGSVQEFSDLPPVGKPGSVLEVSGSISTAFDNYYVQFVGTERQGTWQEVPKPGSLLGLDAGTLPVRVVKNGDLVRNKCAYDLPIATTFSPLVAFITQVTIPDTVIDGRMVSTTLYPKGSTYAVSIFSDAFPGTVEKTFTYTVVSEAETAASVAAGLSAMVDADAAYTSTYFSGGLFNVGRTVPTFPPTVYAAPGWDRTHNAWSPSIVMTPGEHVGRTLVNLTKDQTAVITGNGVYTFQVAGSLLTWDPGDQFAVRGSGTYFVVEQCPWVDRSVGDDITSPFPSFVGQTVSDLFVHQGRMGFVSGSNIVLSAAGDLFNFFRGTATEILASDPIDISGAAVGATNIHSAVEWHESIYLWTNDRQYLLFGSSDGPWTPTTIRLKKISDYLCDAAIRPAVSGTRLFFTATKGGFPRVMEYTAFGTVDGTVHQAVDTTKEVPTYFSGTPLHLVADDQQGIVLLHTTTGMFVLSYAYEAGQKVQNAWHQWSFSAGKILGLDIQDGTIGFVTAYADGTFFEEMLLDPGTLLVYQGFAVYDGSLFFDGTVSYDGGPTATVNTTTAVHLDRFISTDNPGLLAAFDGVNTTWTLPFNVAVNGSEGTIAVAIDNPSTLLTVTRPAPNQVSAVGNYAAHTAFVGILYASTAQFPVIYPRPNETVDTTGRLQVRFLKVHYEDATSLSVSVTITGRAPATYSLSFTTPQNGILLIPVQGLNTEVLAVLSANAAGGDSLISYEWEGTLYHRARPI